MKNEMLEMMLERTNKNAEEWLKLDRGAQKAVRAYYDSKQYEELVINDLWEEDIEGCVNCLRMCGINKLIFAETSTEATKCLMKMLEMNCKIVGTEVYNEEDFGWKKLTYKGIVIEL